MNKASTTTTLLAAGALALALSACGNDGDRDRDVTTVPVPPVPTAPETATPDTLPTAVEPTAAETTAAAGSLGSVDVFSIPTPACFNMVDFTVATEVELLDCTTPHNSEAYASFTFPEGDYPGDETIETTGEQFCYDEFTAYVGVPWDESEFDFYHLSPTQETWESIDDREVLCVAESLNMETASIAGSGR